MLSGNRFFALSDRSASVHLSIKEFKEYVVIHMVSNLFS